MILTCTFYIVRHGQTDWNVRKIWQGHTDIPLNSLGEEQAKDAGSKLKSIHFEAAFSSDLIRAKRTAELITLERNLAIKTNKALRERYGGMLEGKSYPEIQELLKRSYDEYEALPDHEKHALGLNPDWESDERLMGRFITFLREIAVGYSGKNVLIVTHGGVMRSFLLHIGFAARVNLPPGSIANTAYVKVESDGVEFNVVETNGVNRMG